TTRLLQTKIHQGSGERGLQAEDDQVERRAGRDSGDAQGERERYAGGGGEDVNGDAVQALPDELADVRDGARHDARADRDLAPQGGVGLFGWQADGGGQEAQE